MGRFCASVARFDHPPNQTHVRLAVPKRKNWRIAKRFPRTNLRLTKVEAEVLFIILNNGSPMTYEDIAASYTKRFGQKKAKKPTTIKVCVNNIKRLEAATSRKYLEPSGSKPERYKIHGQFVEYQRTAVILMESAKGYRQLHARRPLEWQVDRADFENYVSQTYRWDPGLIRNLIDEAVRSFYLSLQELEPNKPSMRVEKRLNDDEEYLRLILEDYIQQREQEDPATHVLPHLRQLLSLYRLESPSKDQAADR